ncbi:hypothetical protein FNF27_07225 [Cafeteria roenbergensis]|uniref:Uncharacterized protein n=1 Tax=Cafeteria roenbergensis TaxID=33653 RepID=A0A5A8DRR1_CAFRO|nr:hypothetical protein FNF27_07225 [Cafeteria roenbergensis]
MNPFCCVMPLSLAGLAVAHAVSVDVVLGDNLGPLLPARLVTHLEATGAAVSVQATGKCGGSSDLCLAFGSSPASRAVIGPELLAQAGAEGFVVSDGRLAGSGSGRLIAVDGNPGQLPRVGDPSPSAGAAYGAYAVLERVGFGFVHAFQPVIPSSLAFAASFAPPTPQVTVESPKWPVRSWHYHTEHPLELTDFLQGFDASCAGVNASAAPHCAFNESWESMFPDMLRFVDWLLAARQNRLEWIPLLNWQWGDQGTSPQRLARFRNITATLHAAGLLAVVDVPVAERQQNAWYMTNATGSIAECEADIASHIDQWAAAGFDVLATESGFSEFTHPACDVMLALLNFTADYASDAYGMPAYVKAHCSTGQSCPNFTDPRTGQPIDFNFLPALGSPRLNVMPHTVQVYSRDDPAGDSYGNANLTYMFDFATWLAERSTARGDGREVVWHGESAYWVNYDIDVGLALGPLYGERRLNDLRWLAAQQAASGGGMAALRGQNVFASGSPWSYWVGNTVAARAAWDPQAAGLTQEQAFAAALDPVAAALFFGSDQGEMPAQRLKAVLGKVVTDHRQLLVLGNATGVPAPPPGPQGTTYRNGMAYLGGADTWSTVETLVQGHSTQPKRVFLAAVTNWTKGQGAPPGYLDVLAPLLRALRSMTAAHLVEVASLAPMVRPEAAELFADLVAAFNMTALRAAQVEAVYEAASPSSSNTTRHAALGRALLAIRAAGAVVAANEPRYGVSSERVAGWRGTPTSYGYGFLWTVRSLMYMWRDYGLATAVTALAEQGEVQIERLSPCYMNINDPLLIGLGSNELQELGDWARREAEKTGIDWVKALGNCLAQPDAEPQYPRDL